MRLYDVESSAQDGFVEDRPVMDTSRFNDEEEAGGFGLKRGKKDFSKLRMA
jgi:hypothetical protein